MKIPEHRVKRTLRQVKPGETVYASPDVLVVDQNGEGWVLVERAGTSAPPKDDEYGTFLRLKRIISGWEVTASLHPIYAASFGWGQVENVPERGVEAVIFFQEEIRS